MGVILTFTLSYILYRIIFPPEKYSTGFSREQMTPKTYKKDSTVSLTCFTWFPKKNIQK